MEKPIYHPFPQRLGPAEDAPSPSIAPVVLPDEFKVDAMFDAFLIMMGFTDKRKILPFQMKQMRKAFAGGMAMLLALQRDSLGGMNENVAAEVMQQIMNECEVIVKTE
jgi:hypothetical protein